MPCDAAPEGIPTASFAVFRQAASTLAPEYHHWLITHDNVHALRMECDAGSIGALG